MAVDERTATDPAGGPVRTRGWPEAIAVGAGTAVAAVVVAAQFLSIYPVRGYSTPIASDTLKYIWRSRLAEAAGLGAIARVPAGTTVNADRPGFPVIASVVHSVLGASPFLFSFVVPAVGAVLIGLGAAALMTSAVDEPRWSFPLYLLGVGCSVNVTLMAVGYDDNLLVTAVLLGAATCALLAADRRRGMAATAVLLAGAALVHWLFTALLVAVLAAVAVALIPESVLARRRGARLLDTPSARIAGGIGAGVAGGAALVLLAPGAPTGATASRGTFLLKLGPARTASRFPVVGPLAAAGAAAVAVPRSARRLRGLAFLVVWGLTVLAGIVALEMGLSVPAHRVIMFAVAIPILAVAALVGAVRGLWRVAGERRALRLVAGAAGAAVVAAGMWATLAVAHDRWFALAHPVLRFPPDRSYPADRAFAEAATAAAYVARDGGGRPVVYLVEPDGAGTIWVMIPAAGVVRDAVPADQLLRTAFYTGDTRTFLRGRPSLSPFEPKFDYASRRYWEGSRPFAKRAIAIELLAFNPRLVHHPDRPREPGRWIARGVWLVRGPAPSGPIPVAEPPRRPPTWVLALLTLGVPALLGVAGSGWAAALVEGGRGLRAAMAPAFGIAVLSVGGLAADGVGIRLHGPGAIGVLVAVAGAGWAVRWVMARRREAVGPPPATGETPG